MTSTRFIRTVLVFSLTTTLASCALDGDDPEGDAVDESQTDEAIELQGWAPLEIAEVPSGGAMQLAAAARAFQCPADFACLYENHNGGGRAVAIRSGFGLPDLRQLNFSDVASSWRNRAGRKYCWYRDINFNGPAHGMAAGHQANITGAPNNEASSFKPC